MSNSFFAYLKAGLTRSSRNLTDGITGVLTKRRLDDAALDALEEILIAADLGPRLAAQVVDRLRKERFGKEATETDVRHVLADEIGRTLAPVEAPLPIDDERAPRPFVVLVVGVNGGGKTTTIGKLAKRFNEEGRSVVLAAGDTFRAAAAEQLAAWGERTGSRVITGPAGGDAASLAFDALATAKKNKADVLLIDTAGRLHNKANLMAELEKIVRVLRKADPAAPHAVLLVLDATIGQNAQPQAQAFRDIVGVTGVVMTKLDGTAKGGVLVAIAEAFALPVHFIGIGEGADDLRPFAAKDFARSLVGLD